MMIYIHERWRVEIEGKRNLIMTSVERVEKRALLALSLLIEQGRDIPSCRKYAAAARSWCSMSEEIGKKNGALHSRRRGGPGWKLWSRVIEMCDEGGSK